MPYTDYIDAAALLDTCDSLAGDTPGKAAGCKFLGQAEGATTAAANRPHTALAVNMDNLKLPLDSQLAVTQVAALTAFSGNSIDIDMTVGAAGDINYSPIGYLYVGNATYAALPAQEALDTLFQLLDEDYNEVTVEGEEVKVNAITVGPAVGSGFYNTAMATLGLNKTLPVGNYRLSYARDASLATLPDDALIRADIRGLHEAAAESGYKSVIVVAVDDSQGPADYVGASALEDALNDLAPGGDVSIFARSGDYTFTGAFTFTGAGGGSVRIYGVSASYLSQATRLAFQGGAYDLIVDTDNIEFHNLVMRFTTGNGVRWNGNDGRMCDVMLYNGELDITGSHFRGERVFNFNLTPTARIPLILDGADHVSLSSCRFEHGATVLYVGPANCTDISMENCSFVSDDDTCFDVQSKITRGHFVNCSFEAADGLALYVDQHGFNKTEFHGCNFKSTPAALSSQGIVDTFVPGVGVASYLGVLFSHCNFENPDGTVRYRNPAFRMVSVASDTGERYGLRFMECDIRDDSCGFEDGVGGGVPGVSIEGADGENLSVNFANIAADMREDGPVLHMLDCEFKGVDVFVNPIATSIAVSSRAAVELYRGCVIKGLNIRACSGEWTRPALLIEGDTATIPTPPYNRRFSIVDGLEIHNVGVAHWHNNGGGAGQWPLVVEVGELGILRRFTWNGNNVAAVSGTSSGQTWTLVKLAGDRAEVTDCHIDLDTSGTTKRYIRHVIAMDGAAIDEVKIQRNFIRIADGDVVAQGMRAVIYIDGPAAGAAYSGIISENSIYWWGDYNPVHDNYSIITAQNNAYFWKVINNHIYVDDIHVTASGVLIWWETTPGTYPIGAGGTLGAAIITGNTLFNNNVGAANSLPVIAGAGSATNFVGIADNILARA